MAVKDKVIGTLMCVYHIAPVHKDRTCLVRAAVKGNLQVVVVSVLCGFLDYSERNVVTLDMHPANSIGVDFQQLFCTVKQLAAVVARFDIGVIQILERTVQEFRTQRKS